MTTFQRLGGTARYFAHNHDEVPAFHAAYLVLTFLAAAIFSLGFFALLIGVHMALDTVKYRDAHGYSVRATARAVFLESLIDIVLLLAAFLGAIYFHHEFLLPLASGLLRAQLTIIRGVTTILPRMEILEHMLHVSGNLHAYIYTPHPDVRTSILSTHRWAMLILGMEVALIAIAISLYAQRGVDFWLVTGKLFALSL